MGNVCSCGSPMCPICNPKARTKAVEGRQALVGKPNRAATSETPNVPRHEPETEGIRTETANVRPETEVVRGDDPGMKVITGKTVNLSWANESGVCTGCGRPFCPECGKPIPVRGDYCKPACRSRAWRKKKAE